MTVELPKSGPYVLDGVLYNNDAEVAAWVRQGLGGVGPVAQLCRAVAVVADGANPGDPAEWVCGVIFHNLIEAKNGSRGDVTITVHATPRLVENLLTFRSSIRQMLAVPFEQYGLSRISAEIDLANDRSVRNAEMLGFVREGEKRGLGARGGNVGIYGLLKEDAKARGFWFPLLDAKAA